MENSFFHRLSNTLWIAIVVMLVLLAAYVSVGRMLTANLGTYKTAILRELNYRVPFTIEAEQVSGEWHSFTPVIVFSGLRLSVPDSSEAPLELPEGRVGVDVLNSLRTGSLQMTRIALTDLSLRGELTSEGKLLFTGFGSGGGKIGDWLREFLLNVELVALQDNLLKLTMPSGEVRNLDLNLLLSRDGSHRQMDAQLTTTRGADITILAEGVGDPSRPQEFAGNIYLSIHTPDLGAVKDIVAPGALPVWADGAVDLELWLAWDKGLPTLDFSFEGRDLLVSGEDVDLQLPLQRMALQGHLLQGKNSWTLYASDLQLVQGGNELTLPRLQLDIWGSSLRIRAVDVPLQPVNAMFTELEATPEKLRNVLSTLQPRGTLSTLQVSLGDIEQLNKDWEIEANFEAVAVEPFKGAPGVTSATGYTQLGPLGGFVVLDSRAFSMSFPSIYHRALDFDEFYGTLYLDWDAQSFTISSGVVTGQGNEGRAQVLFGLDIPLVPSESGIVMDLMVGLQNADPSYRSKYIPYLLNPSLLTWLSDSIGPGRIEQGAFLWRGSLARDKATMRTIQLAFNITETQLDYHPQWPPVTVHEGVVFIDDSAVSVWSERASMLHSVVDRLSVETRLNEKREVILELQASMVGPAADGLQVLNESPLADIVGSAFGQWQMSGDLETDLDLKLNLGDKSVPPVVEVDTRWREVDLHINPGNLPVENVSGQFSYSTARGFSSTGLEARLWEEVLNVSLEQHHRAGGKYDAGASVLDISLATEVDMADVRRWLQLQPLAFVSGQTTASVGVRVTPGQAPLLTVESSLAGVGLDLPQPWAKTEDQETRFYLEMPLAGDARPLSIHLGEDLKLSLELGDGGLRGGSLGIGAAPATVEAGIFHIGGQTPLVQGDQWIHFVTEYLGVGSPLPGVNDVVHAPDMGVPVPDVAAGIPVVLGDVQTPPLEVVVEALQAEQLVILDQALQDVVLSLDLEETLWTLSVDTDWLRGNLALARDDSRSRLDIEHLDISRLSEFTFFEEQGAVDPQGEDSGEHGPASEDDGSLELPPMDVTLENIYQSEARLGELAFGLGSTGGVLTVDNISGALARLKFSEDRPGKLVWYQGSEGYTELQAGLGFEDLGKTLQYFGYERILETKSGSFDIDLRWPGTPQGFSLLQGRGAVQVKIGQGSFLEAPSGATGALRVVSILNLADIVRRLSLSHMFESGIPFDSVEGEVYLHEGTIEVTRMDVKGGSSFQFSGVSDVAEKSLNGKLVATLPVARNLPWIAALAASLPVAAGVFIVSKVFDKQMNRLSSAVYTIDGSWNDPQVSFERVFDNTQAPQLPQPLSP